jgi:L-2-hydroxyglutarate oxidase LhgO
MNRVVIIGAGIVGLHVAHEFHEKGFEVFVLEKEPYLAEGISGRNTGVIHAGVFYTPNSFKEKICLEGNRLTYDWLNTLKIPYNPCGKWVIPFKEQESELEAFYDKVSHIPDLKPAFIEGDLLKEKEPHLKQSRALFIPSTGVLDAATYVKALAVYVENKGVTITKNCTVTDVSEHKLQTSRGEIAFDLAINAAGLFSDTLARLNGIHDYTIKPCRGDYYIVNRTLLQKPVYHLPQKESLGLGLHLTPTLDGQTLIGPNAFFIDDKEDYTHHSDAENFYNSLAFHLSGVKKEQLTPAYSGNRPKLFKNNKPHPEFTIVKKDNWIHLLGIESPGLTGAPALAKSLSSGV